MSWTARDTLHPGNQSSPQKIYSNIFGKEKETLTIWKNTKTVREGILKTNKQRDNYFNKNIIVQIFLISKQLLNNYFKI